MAISDACGKISGEPFNVLLGDVLIPGNGMLPRMQTVSDVHGVAAVLVVLSAADRPTSLRALPQYPRMRCTDIAEVREGLQGYCGSASEIGAFPAISCVPPMHFRHFHAARARKLRKCATGWPAGNYSVSATAKVGGMRIYSRS